MSRGRRKETCECCGCAPHAPRHRCTSCDRLVCVSNCWNRAFKQCKDCLDKTRNASPNRVRSDAKPLFTLGDNTSGSTGGYQPRYVICGKRGSWTYPPCSSCGSTGPFRLPSECIRLWHRSRCAGSPAHKAQPVPAARDRTSHGLAEWSLLARCVGASKSR
jgi:hypothetical protein